MKFIHKTNIGPNSKSWAWNGVWKSKSWLRSLSWTVSWNMDWIKSESWGMSWDMSY